LDLLIGREEMGREEARDRAGRDPLGLPWGPTLRITFHGSALGQCAFRHCTTHAGSLNRFGTSGIGSAGRDNRRTHRRVGATTAVTLPKLTVFPRWVIAGEEEQNQEQRPGGAEEEYQNQEEEKRLGSAKGPAGGALERNLRIWRRASDPL
jgi:hypothetical protein